VFEPVVANICNLPGGRSVVVSVKIAICPFPGEILYVMAQPYGKSFEGKDPAFRKKNASGKGLPNLLKIIVIAYNHVGPGGIEENRKATDAPGVEREVFPAEADFHLVRQIPGMDDDFRIHESYELFERTVETGGGIRYVKEPLTMLEPHFAKNGSGHSQKGKALGNLYVSAACPGLHLFFHQGEPLHGASSPEEEGSCSAGFSGFFSFAIFCCQ